jgi:O-antigen ligase
MTVRPILGEMETVQVTQLISPSPLWWNTSPAVMYIAHVLAAVGLLLAVLWAVLARRPWRFTGLEPAVVLLVLAAVVSVPAASDKRLAINVAIGTILPIVVAAVLVQMLADRPLWRRALLAALVAAAVANCWRATRQQLWENQETWEYDLEHKAEYWARQGKSLADPMIPILESRIKANQPSGYFYHPNVLASFLLLGVAASLAGASGLAKRYRTVGHTDKLKGPALATRNPQSATRPFPWAVASLLSLLAVVVWQLIVIKWVGSVGARAGLGLGILAGLIAWFLRGRPRAAALPCLVMLAGLQISLTLLAAKADAIVPDLAQRGGKIKSMAFRLDYWNGAVQLFARHPIAGVGPGHFGHAYPAVKRPRAAEEVAHCHNWLLNVASEWGILGVLGILAALLLPAWLALRAPVPAGRDEPGSEPGPAGSASGAAGGLSWRARACNLPAGPNGQALVLTWIVVFVCWLVFLPGVVPAGSAVFLIETLPALPLALVVAALASVPTATGLGGRIVLLAGLVGFFVHGTVEMASGVPGAMWPFWATTALALAWATDASARGRAAPVSRRALGMSVWAGTLLVAVAVVVLSYSPMRSIWALSEAKSAFQAMRGAHAEGPLLAAAQVDGCDPAPRAALSEFYRRMAQANPDRAAGYLRQAVAYAQAASELDPGNHVRWYDLALTSVELANMTRDSSVFQQAVGAMRRAVHLYPNWPRGHLRFARLLAGVRVDERPDVRRHFLTESLTEFDQALRLDEQWPSDDPNKFDARERSDVRVWRQRVEEELEKGSASRPAEDTPPNAMPN